MTTRTAHTEWNGDLKSGKGSVALDSSGAGTFTVDWPARTETADGKTSPEELIAAAHSACYSMALSNALATGGNPPERIETKADVVIDKTESGFAITTIHLTVRGTVPGMSADAFQDAAEGAKTGCPVSKALSGTTITLDAALA